MRVAQVLMAMVFVGFATLQFNDPDAVLWIGAYTMVAVQCAASAARRPSTAASILLTVILITWATVITINEGSSLSHLNVGELPSSEVAREIAGLGVAAGWCALTAAHAARKRWAETT